MPKGTKTIALGVDRTSVPIATPTDRKCRRRPRSKKYARKRPKPVEVKYQMDYVATLTFLDKNGESLMARRSFGTRSATGFAP